MRNRIDVGRTVTFVVIIVLAACAGSSGPESPALPPGVAYRSTTSTPVDPDGRLPALPAVVVAADGRAVLPAPPGAAIEGQLLPTLWQFDLTPADVARIDAAAGAGPLFEGPAETHLAELAAIVGELPAPSFYLPEEYLFVASPAGDEADGPTLTWPDFASVPLASAGECTRAPETEVGEAFETAAAGSRFTDRGVRYAVVAVQAWPGAEC